MNGNEQWGGYHVVLASASPRRKELLNQIGIFPEIRPSQMEEETVEKKPEQVVMELSRQKAEDIAAGCGTGTMVIGADTVVAVGNEILGKPGTPRETSGQDPSGLYGRDRASMPGRGKDPWDYLC